VLIYWRVLLLLKNIYTVHTTQYRVVNI